MQEEINCIFLEGRMVGARNHFTHKVTTKSHETAYEIPGTSGTRGRRKRRNLNL